MTQSAREQASGKARSGRSSRQRDDRPGGGAILGRRSRRGNGAAAHRARRRLSRHGHLPRRQRRFGDRHAAAAADRRHEGDRRPAAGDGRALSGKRRHLRAGRVRARRAAVRGGSAAPHRLRSRADQPRRGCLLDPAVRPCAPGGCRHRAAARCRARAGHAREQAHGAPGDRRRWARGQPRLPGSSRRAGGTRSGGRPPRPHECLATKGPPRADGRRTRPRRRRVCRRPQRARVAVPNASRGSDVRGLRRRRQLRAAVSRRRARAGRAWDAGE